MPTSNVQSFNDLELSQGYHLLTESSHPITVHTPTVSLDRTHLYPRLAGSNWTSYLTRSSVIIGRSGANGKTRPDIDFGNATKAVSRKHCEIRYSHRRERWELIVFSRNGVIVNRLMKKPKDRPVVLQTGALIEINHTRFVFILPNQALKPVDENIQTSTQEPSPLVNVTTPADELSEEGATPDAADDTVALDQELESAMIQLFEKYKTLSTKEILKELESVYTKKPIEKNNIMHLLVLSPRFSLAPTSINMSSKDSDSAKWVLIPSNTSPTSAPPTPHASISKSFDEDDDHFDWMPSTPLDHQSQPEMIHSTPSTGGVPFKSIPLEHIYSIWTNSSSLLQKPGGEERPTKRPKNNHDQDKETDIFKQVRTNIL